ncbi:MAG: AEC family transporter [Candidatus Sericytochromatia bacterium]
MKGLFLLSLMGVGMGLQRWPQLTAWLLPRVTAWVLWVAIPAVTLLYLTRLEMSSATFLPAGAAWLVFAGAVLWLGFWKGQQRFVPLDRATLGCLLLTAGLGNTSFVGFPVVSLLYGEEALQTAVLVDQPGSFLILGTLGLVVAAGAAGERLQPRQVAQRLLGFPPFLAFAAALLAQLLRWQPGPLLSQGLGLLAMTLSPLALLAVGLQLQPRLEKHWLRPLTLGLGYKLFLAPLLVLLVYGGLYQAGALPLSARELQICVLEAAMGPMITGALVAAGAGLQPRLASLMVGIGIPLSLLSLGLWYALLRLFWG